MNSQSHNADELEPEGLHGVACLVIIAAAASSRVAAEASSRAAAAEGDAPEMPATMFS